MKKVPPELDKIVDIVLAYRPKKKEKKRQQKRSKNMRGSQVYNSHKLTLTDSELSEIDNICKLLSSTRILAQKKCEKCVDGGSGMFTCPHCHGTGTLSRELEAEEAFEVLKEILMKRHEVLYELEQAYYYILLPDGSRLVVREDK
jgi:DnaJ-class molecular chaperone